MKKSDALVKGCIRHTEHATIALPCWRQALLSTESAARNPFVAFFD